MDPYHLLFRGGQFYLIGHSHERDDMRVFRVSRIRGKVGYSSKAEHDFNRPEEFDPREYATAPTGSWATPSGRASIWLSDRIDWLALRHFGHAGEVRREVDGGKGVRDRATPTRARSCRGCSAWARRPASRAARAGRGGATSGSAGDRAPREPARAGRARKRGARRGGRGGGGTAGESPIRPERFARLVTLAGILIDAAREGAQARRRRAVRQAPGDRAGAAPGHRRAERRQLRRRHATCSTRRSRATRSRSTPSPTATTSPARPGCSRSRRRRSWRRST